MATILTALGSGITGAVALTAAHQAARRTLRNAPRMDVLGMKAIAKPIQAAGYKPPRGRTLPNLSLAGDLIANSLYYSAVALGEPKGAWRRGALLGLAAGIGAVALPGPLGLGNSPSNRTPATTAMTIAWYTLGGLAAAATFTALRNSMSSPRSI